jgi:hypothetical protein
MINTCVFQFKSIQFQMGINRLVIRGCSGSQKVGARKIARCHFQVPILKVRIQFRSQLKFLQGAYFSEPKLWMIACTTTSFMFSFTYKWSGFVCTNVNVCIVLLFFISISSSKTKRFIQFITIYCILRIIRDSARILRPLVTFAEQIFNELNLIISYFALLVSNGD